MIAIEELLLKEHKLKQQGYVFINYVGKEYKDGRICIYDNYFNVKENKHAAIYYEIENYRIKSLSVLFQDSNF
jgi:hypothetical protein